MRQIEGTLDSFLVADVAEAGAPPQLAYAMSEVLQWDLDFNRDLRQGDYLPRALRGREARRQLLTASAACWRSTYVNQGVEHEAFLWEDDADEIGYYDRDGRPLQKMFLRSPLPFTRVTSRFTHRRFHPVLKTYRPHYGVDFGAPAEPRPGSPPAAPSPSPAAAAAPATWCACVHANGYETSYLHLSGYGPGVRTGKRLRQGDIVGYVGSTGLSTGPHLDYRVKRNGKYMDPMKLENRPPNRSRSRDSPPTRSVAIYCVSALVGELDPARLVEPAADVQLASVSVGRHGAEGSGALAR